MSYLKNFEDIREIFNANNQIDFDILQKEEYFKDFYNIIIQFQRKTLARTSIPLDYYKAIAEGKPVSSFNPNVNLMFTISPYFKFDNIEDMFYEFTRKFSRINSDDYVILRFPKEILHSEENLKTIVKDFSQNSGIMLNIIDIDEYSKLDIEKYFPKLVDLIYDFSGNGQEVITMNNSELCKYFKIFGLSYVCTNVMIGQKTWLHESEKKRSGFSSNLIFVPEIERSISIADASTLQLRNERIKSCYSTSFSELDNSQKNEIYFDHIKKRLSVINSSNASEIIKEMEESLGKIDFPLHISKYDYYNAWQRLIQQKMRQYKI